MNSEQTHALDCVTIFNSQINLKRKSDFYIIDCFNLWTWSKLPFRTLYMSIKFCSFQFCGLVYLSLNLLFSHLLIFDIIVSDIFLIAPSVYFSVTQKSKIYILILQPTNLLTLCFCNCFMFLVHKSSMNTNSFIFFFTFQILLLLFFPYLFVMTWLSIRHF